MVSVILCEIRVLQRCPALRGAWGWTGHHEGAAWGWTGHSPATLPRLHVELGLGLEPGLVLGLGLRRCLELGLDTGLRQAPLLGLELDLGVATTAIATAAAMDEDTSSLR